MIPRHPLLILVLLGLLPLSLAAQNSDSTTYRFTLEQAVEYAVKNQPTILNAQIDEEIARQQKREIRGLGLPQVAGKVDFQYFAKRPTSILPNFGLAFQPLVQPLYDQSGIALPDLGPATIPVQFGTKYSATVGASVSQLLFDGSFLIGLQAAHTYQELARKNTMRTTIETVNSVTKAYYSVLVNQERMKLLDANLVRMKQTFKETKGLLDAGFAEKLDVDRLSVMLANMETEAENVKALNALSKELLKFQMGMPETAKIELTDQIRDSDMTSEPAQSEVDYRKRIEMQLLNLQQQMYDWDRRRNLMGYLPNLVAFGSFNIQEPRDDLKFFSESANWFPTAIFGATMNIPIFDGFQKDARIQIAKANMAKIDNQKHNLELAINLEASQARIQYNNAIQSLTSQRRNLELAEDIVRVSRIKYREGVGSNIEVLNAETTLREAQTNFISSLYDAIIAQVNLQKAKGELY